MTRSAPGRILIVALDNLGDAVMASAVLKPLKKLYPQARVGVLVKAYAAELFADHSLVDNVHAADPFWDVSPGRGKGGALQFLSALSRARREHYDVAFILNTEWRRALACLLARVPRRVGYARRKSSLFLTMPVPYENGARHFVDDHRMLVERWSGQEIPVDDCRPRLELADGDARWWKHWSAENGLSDRGYSVFHLFSGDEEKNWPLQSWLGLLESRARHDPAGRFVLLTGPGESVKLEPYLSRIAGNGVVFLTAPALPHLKAALAHARVMVGGDSGPGHVAAALGTPVVSLFGKTNPERSRPIGLVRVLHGSPLGSLSVAEVSEAMDTFLPRV